MKTVRVVARVTLLANSRAAKFANTAEKSMVFTCKVKKGKIPQSDTAAGGAGVRSEGWIQGVLGSDLRVVYRGAGVRYEGWIQGVLGSDLRVVYRGAGVRSEGCIQGCWGRI